MDYMQEHVMKLIEEVAERVTRDRIQDAQWKCGFIYGWALTTPQLGEVRAFALSGGWKEHGQQQRPDWYEKDHTARMAEQQKGK